MDINRKTGTDFWDKDIRKEMKKVRIAFKKVNGVISENIRTGNIKPGYKDC